LKELDIDPQTFPITQIRGRISKAKNELQRAADLTDFGSAPIDRITRQVYERYEERLLENNAMDFDDLLLNTARLFQEFPKVLKRYQKRFQYVHVDEYQDTNRAQYIITKLLVAKHRNLMVVGDDDQSIYSWRGADITNILEFEKDYPEAKVVKLEQNYRSTGVILDAANAVVAHNKSRKPKKLFTDARRGEPVSLYLAVNEHDEARYIASEIERIARDDGRSLSEFALFYRTNAQSRVLEDALLRAGVAYKIVGGTRYFDRAEIRDVMAYLKVVVNPADEISLLRIINTPRRGIGNTTLDHVNTLAVRNGISFEAAIRLALAPGESVDLSAASPDSSTNPADGSGDPSLQNAPNPRHSGKTSESIFSPAINSPLRPAAARALAAFMDALKDMRGYTGELPRVIEMIINRSGLLSALEAQTSDEAQGRAENIKEFVNVAAEFAETHEENDLFAFMEWLALRTDLDTLAADSDTVTLMTVHTAKGLEYPVVFVAGMEESLFPHANSIYGEAGVEEERRLAYVAITRARQRLIFTRAANRMVFGSPASNPPSRFLAEIPDELLEVAGLGSDGFEGTSGWEKRGDRHSGLSGHGTEHSTVFGSGGRRLEEGGSASLPGARKKAAKVTYEVGDVVAHKIWGKGTVIGVEGDSLRVNFVDSVGVKNLMRGFAPIVKIES
jgi:DNA helicase-2/ATP-dependent DNA helicase PcrA